MKKTHRQNGYIALMTAIIVSMILLLITIKQNSSGWNLGTNLLILESKEQANILAQGCNEFFIAKLIADNGYAGNSTSTYNGGICYNFPIQKNFPSNGLVTIKTQTIVKNIYTNLETIVDMNDIYFEETPTSSTPQNPTNKNLKIKTVSLKEISNL